MKLVTFEAKTEIGTSRRIGALLEDKVIDLNLAYATYLAVQEQDAKAYEIAAARIPEDMIEFFKGEEVSQREARKALSYVEGLLKNRGSVLGPKGESIIHDREKVKLLTPVRRPNSVRDCLGFEQHVQNMSRIMSGGEIAAAFFEIPPYFRASPDSLVGPDETVNWPSYCELLDYELEFAVFIGKKGVNIPKEKADEYIAGYTIFNDISVRDKNVAGKEISLMFGPAKAKCADRSKAVGPCITTPDEIGNRDNLRMIARVNGEVWSENNSSTMYWKFPELIEYISREETLYPGDLIASGTVGFGSGAELQKWLKPGDIVELEVENIGILRNTVGKHPAAIPLPSKTRK